MKLDKPTFPHKSKKKALAIIMFGCATVIYLVLFCQAPSLLIAASLLIAIGQALIID